MLPACKAFRRRESAVAKCLVMASHSFRFKVFVLGRSLAFIGNGTIGPNLADWLVG
jgi:hypothetical protein